MASDRDRQTVLKGILIWSGALLQLCRRAEWDRFRGEIGRVVSAGHVRARRRPRHSAIYHTRLARRYVAAVVIAAPSGKPHTAVGGRDILPIPGMTS